MPSETASPIGVPMCSLGQPLLVDAVAGLVHRRAERVVDVRLVEARGQAHVVAVRAAAERMRRDVEPAALVVEADRLGDEAHERLLLSMGSGNSLNALDGFVELPMIAEQSPAALAQRREHLLDVPAPCSPARSPRPARPTARRPPAQP